MEDIKIYPIAQLILYEISVSEVLRLMKYHCAECQENYTEEN